MVLAPTVKPPTLRVAIIRSSSIGDVVLATACLDLLRRLRMPTEAVWVGRAPSLRLIADAFPEIRCVELAGTRNWTAVQATARELADVHLAIDLQTNLRTFMLARALKAHNIPTYTCDKRQLSRSQMIWWAQVRGRSRVGPPELRTVTRFQFESMTATLVRALKAHLPEEAADAIDATARPVVDLSRQEVAWSWLSELRLGRWLAVAPGGSYAAKRAPLSLFVDIFQRLADDEGSDQLGLVFVGDEDDRSFARSLLDQVSWTGPSLNLAGKLTLWETAHALEAARVLLSNDTALVHIAEAVGTPVGVLFGPTVEAFGFAPHRPLSKAFSAPIGCRPCSKHGARPCRYRDLACFAQIPVDAIHEFLRDRVAVRGAE